MKKLLSFVLASAMALSLVACGTGATGTTNPDPTDSSAPAVETSYKKEVVVAMTPDFENKDPQTASTFQNTRVYQLVYDRLVHYDPTTQEISPMLAESWEMSADGSVYTFKLRDDVTFHNGEKFTADDVVFTVERGKESPLALIKNYYNAIAECEALDEHTVKMTLEKPNGDFLFTISFPYMGILNREACEADPENGVEVGTGLWIWEKFADNDYCSFVRNDNYWGESTPTERLVMRVIPEAASRLIALENGEIDMAAGINAEEIEFVEANDEIELVSINSVTLRYASFNMEVDGPWQDVNFRKACAHAIDSEAFILGYLSGYGTRATSVWSHAQFGYAPPEGYDYDVEVAKDYLAKSNYAGETVTLTTVGGYKTAALILADMMQKVGINVVVEEIASANYADIAREGRFEMMIYQISFTAPGSDTSRLLASSNQGKRSQVNTEHCEEIAQLMDEALVESDTNKRLEMYAEVQELVSDDCSILPLVYPTVFCAQDKDMDGIVYSANTDYDYRYVKVAE